MFHDSVSVIHKKYHYDHFTGPSPSTCTILVNSSAASMPLLMLQMYSPLSCNSVAAISSDPSDNITCRPDEGREEVEEEEEEENLQVNEALMNDEESVMQGIWIDDPIMVVTLGREDSVATSACERSGPV